MEANIAVLQNVKERSWLYSRGKGDVLDFTDEELKKLRECFSSLDDDGGGSIGIEELEEPLIGLGFANNREEVQQIIDAVDDDGSGNIEFPEFLGIILGGAGGGTEEGVNVFFKNLSNGAIGKKELSFAINVQNIRRNYMIDAIWDMTDPGKTREKKD